MSLSQCAAAYSLTDSLSSEPATAAPSSVPSSLPVAVSASASTTVVSSYAVSTPSSTVTAYTTSTYAAYTTSIALGTGTGAVGSNVTATPTNSVSPVQFTGAAEKMVLGGLKGLAIAAGALLVL